MTPFRQIAKYLDSRGLWLPLVFRSHWYDRVDKENFRGALLIAKKTARSCETLKEIDMRARALEVIPQGDRPVSGPPLELLLVCASKDFMTLPFAINQALSNCKNSIDSVTVITPDRDRNVAESICEQMENRSEKAIQVRCDSDFLSEESFRRLRLAFGERFGWIAQQLITTSFVLQSKANAILVLNADTLLIRNQTFLKSDGTQVLHRSSEYMPDYYRFLRSLDGTLATEATHITHHMLMQPAIMREIFKSLGLKNIGHLQDNVIAFSAQTGQKAFCLEFEMYAQFVKKLFPERIKEVKFSNIGVPRPENERKISALIDYHQRVGKFNTLSLHDYLS